MCEGLLGKPEYFVSHWWGYKWRNLIAMIREHDNALVASGKPPGVYWLDHFVLNENGMADVQQDKEQWRRKIVTLLRTSLRNCGNLLLCCSAGSQGIGWERPAPIARVWCLFEVYAAILEDVKVIVQLAPTDMVEFQRALLANGMQRVERALESLDARNAGASVMSDKELILADIEADVGIAEFNRRVRERVLAEYKRVATSAGMR